MTSEQEIINSLELLYAKIKASGSDTSMMSKQLTKAYEAALSGVFKGKIWQQSRDGRWKCKVDGIQIVKKDKLDVYRELYRHYFDSEMNESLINASLKDVYCNWYQDYTTKVEQGHRSPGSLRKHKSLWEKYIANSSIERKPIESIKVSEIKRLFETVAAGQAVTRKELSNLKTVINMVFSYARDNDLHVIDTRGISTRDVVCLGDDRIDDDDEDEPSSEQLRVYTTEERDKIIAEAIKHLDDVYCRAIIVMFNLCARSGEVRALSWKDINFETQTVRIHRSMVQRRVEGKDTMVRVNRTKNRQQSGNRTLWLTKQAIDVLLLQRKDTAFSDYIFLNSKGKPLGCKYFLDKLKKICLDAGVTYRGSHAMRFWSITALAESGAPLPEIQRIAGHSSMGMTMHYIRPERQQVVGLSDWETTMRSAPQVHPS